MILFDIAPDPFTSAPVGLAIAAAFFLILAGIAFIIFKVIARSVKMAVRMIIVTLILAVALIGSASLWWFLSTPGKADSPRRPPIKSNR
jgi:hypothetical protein